MLKCYAITDSVFWFLLSAVIWGIGMSVPKPGSGLIPMVIGEKLECMKALSGTRTTDHILDQGQVSDELGSLVCFQYAGGGYY